MTHARKPGQRALELFVGVEDLRADTAAHNSPAEPGVLVAHGSTGGAADGRTRLAGDDEATPKRRAGRAAPWR